MAFSDEQPERYSRHIILEEIGIKWQKKLPNTKVPIIGAGGLDAPAAMYLAAGVGTIGIADADEVKLVCPIYSGRSFTRLRTLASQRCSPQRKR